MKKLFLFGLFLLTILSCRNDTQVSIPEFNNDNLVDVSLAVKIAEVQSTIGNETGAGKSLRVSAEKKIKSILEVNPKSSDPSFYIMNYENGGFAIVSGDRRLRPVLAYSEQNTFPTDVSSYPSGLVGWLETTHLQVAEARSKNLKQSPLVKEIWTRLENNTKLSSLRTMYDDPIPDPDPRCNSEGIVIYDYQDIKGPLLQTQWGQGTGYNDLLANLSCSAYANGRVPTGCVATATAQIMRYFSFPSTYTWSAMNNTSGSSQTALLMKDIGTAVSMSYACDGSAAVLSDAATALTGTFGYTSASYGNYNSSTVESEIANYNAPVILGGGRADKWWFFNVYADGHAWVCDGYIRTHYSLCEKYNGVGPQLVASPYYSTLSLHMNWGWNGYYDGWYSYDNFNPGSNTFNYKTRQITNIRRPI